LLLGALGSCRAAAQSELDLATGVARPMGGMARFKSEGEAVGKASSSSPMMAAASLTGIRRRSSRSGAGRAEATLSASSCSVLGKMAFGSLVHVRLG
jgi:hypothetical protein